MFSTSEYNQERLDLQVIERFPSYLILKIKGVNLFPFEGWTHKGKVIIPGELMDYKLVFVSFIVFTT